MPPPRARPVAEGRRPLPFLRVGVQGQGAATHRPIRRLLVLLRRLRPRRPRHTDVVARPRLSPHEATLARVGAEGPAPRLHSRGCCCVVRGCGAPAAWRHADVVPVVGLAPDVAWWKVSGDLRERRSESKVKMGQGEAAVLGEQEREGK